MSSGRAHGQIKTVSVFESSDSAVFIRGRLVLKQRRHVTVERANLFGRTRVPALHNTFRVAAHEQFMCRIKLAAVVLNTGRRLERSFEAALLQIEAVYFVAGAHKIQIACRIVVVKVSTKFGYAYLVVFAVLRVKFNVAIVV